MSENRDRLLILVRHGETVASSSVRLVGAGDVALSPLGWRQARRLRDVLRSVPLARAASSALERARATASIILEGRGVPLDVDPALNEVSFGKWEGLTLEEVCRRDPQLQAPWRGGDPDFAYPGGDTRRGFRERVRRGWREVRRRWDGGPPGSEHGGAWLLVAHKGVLRTILADLAGQGGPDPDAIELGSIARVRLGAGGAVAIESMNEVAHLGADRVPGS